jgi:hypothetical protein
MLISKVFLDLSDEFLCKKLLLHIDDVSVLADVAQTAVLPQIRVEASEKMRGLSSDKDMSSSNDDDALSADTFDDELKYSLFERERLCKNIENATGHGDAETVKAVEKWQQHWTQLGKLPEQYFSLTERFASAVEKFRIEASMAEIRAAERREKLKKIDDIIREVESLVSKPAAEIDFKAIDAVAKRWAELTDDIKDIEESQQKFKDALGRASIKQEELRQQQAAAMDLLDGACRKLQQFIAEDNPESRKTERAELDKQVRAAYAIIPEHNSRKEKLFAEYLQLNKHFSSILHERYVTRDLDRWANYTMKLEICRQLEAIQTNPNIHEIAHKLKEAREHWKKIGHVPVEKLDEINSHFKQLNDVMQQQCNVFYEKLNQEKEEAAKLKTILCEEAETLCQANDWNQTAEKLKSLQAQWKSLPVCHTGTEQDLFRRFNQSCSSFFDARKAYYEEAHSRFEQRAAAKQALCSEAKQFLSQPPQNDFRKRIKIFWERWKEIGHSGKAEAELYELFRGGFDNFYDTMREQLNRNLVAANELYAELHALHTNLNSCAMPLPAIRQKCREISDKWQNIGELPHEEEPQLEKKFSDMLHTLKISLQTEQQRQILRLFNELEQREKIISGVYGAAVAADGAEASWQQLGPTADEIKHLDQFFKQICQAKLGSDEAALAKINNQFSANLKIRKKLCSELEELAGIAADEDSNKVSSLANELALAISNNFAADSSARQQVDKNSTVKAIQKQWLAASPISLEPLTALSARFIKAYEIAAKPDNNKHPRQD